MAAKSEASTRATTLLVLGLCVSLLGGCVVTNKIEFDVPTNTPPAIVVTGPAGTPPGASIDRIIRVDRSAPPTPVILTFDVRDPDVSQSLEGKIYIDWDHDTGTGPAPTGFLVPPNGTDVRSDSVVVPDSLLRGVGECHRIELLVSGRFDNSGDGRSPVETGDIAQAVFWAEVIDDTHPSADLSTCPN